MDEKSELNLQRKHIMSFSTIKVIAMVGIFLGHAMRHINSNYLDLGARGVELFVIISGFLAYQHRKNWGW